MENWRKKIYLICSIRDRKGKDKEIADAYVARLRSNGCLVHYPSEVPQDDLTGMRIMTKHRAGMEWSDEVHAIWSPTSTGSIGDLGMAWMGYKPIKLVNKYEINKWLKTNPGKSHTRWINEIAKEYNQEVKSVKEFNTVNYIPTIDVVKMLAQLNRGKSGIEDWLMATTGSIEPGGKGGFLSGLLRH